MNLNIPERLLILNLDTLPMVGNIITMKAKQQLLSDLGFTEEEIKEANLRNEEDGKISWDKNFSKEINFGEQGLKMVISAIEKSENVNDMYVPLYDRLKCE